MMQPFLWYNVIVQKQNPQEHYTAYQLKLPVEIEKIIEISDPVYSFSEVMDHIDLNKYLTIEERRSENLAENNTVCVHGERICVGKRDRKILQD